LNQVSDGPDSNLSARPSNDAQNGYIIIALCHNLLEKFAIFVSF